jgi:hypothetical protein
LADAIGLRRENVPQNNSFSASDGEKVAQPDEVSSFPVTGPILKLFRKLDNLAGEIKTVGV